MRDSEVQYLAKAVIQGISLYKVNASMTIIYFVELTLDQIARVFEGRLGHNCDIAIFTCYVRLVGIVPKFE